MQCAGFDKRTEAEVIMPAISQPPKHLVREYLQRRSRESKPPPSPEEIRRELGWGLLLPGLKLAPIRR
jgi:hypothetical protein